MPRTKQRRTYLPFLPSCNRYSFTDHSRMEGWVSPGHVTWRYINVETLITFNICCIVLQGIAEIAGQSDSCDYELIEVTNPDLLLVKGAREDVVLDTCKDLSYLHSLYVIRMSYPCLFHLVLQCFDWWWLGGVVVRALDSQCASVHQAV